MVAPEPSRRAERLYKARANCPKRGIRAGGIRRCLRRVPDFFSDILIRATVADGFAVSVDAVVATVASVDRLR